MAFGERLPPLEALGCVSYNIKCDWCCKEEL